MTYRNQRPLPSILYKDGPCGLKETWRRQNSGRHTRFERMLQVLLLQSRPERPYRLLYSPNECQTLRSGGLDGVRGVWSHFGERDGFVRFVLNEVRSWFTYKTKHRVACKLGRINVQKRLLTLVDRLPRPARSGRRPIEEPTKLLSCLHSPPRATSASSILQMRLIASTREMSSRAYS